MFFVVVVVDVVLNVDDVVYTRSNIDLRLLLMEVEFGWGESGGS